jgi:replicative DNA helicase
MAVKTHLDKIDLDHFEKIFCYKMITDEEYFAAIADVTDPAFFKDKHKKNIFLIIREYFYSRDTIPNLSELKNYLTTSELKESFKSILTEIQGLDKQYNKEELMKNTERYLKERAVYKTILEVADDLQTGDVDTGSLLDKFEKTCNINLTTNIGLDLLNDVDRLIDDINTDQPVIPSKWKWLDNMLDGGFLKNGRALYIFAGQTNVGKSIVLGNIATNIASQGKTVLLITLEMSEMMYARRLSSSMTRIAMKDLRVESLTLKHALEDIKETTPGGRILIKEFPPSTITPSQLSAYIKKLRNKGVFPDAIVLDYVNLLHTNQGSNSYERIKIICEQIRALSYQTECPWISSTQINRGEFNTAPSLTGISESIGLAATADFISSIYQEEDDAENGIIRFGLMKNRFGQNFGKSAFAIDYSTLTIKEDEELNSLTSDSEESRNTLEDLCED